MLRVVNQSAKQDIAVSDNYSVESQAADIKAAN